MGSLPPTGFTITLNLKFIIMYKTIHIINSIAVAITLILYIGVTTGMIAQFFLEILQLLLALALRFSYFKSLPSITKKVYNIYWALVIIAFINIIFISTKSATGSLYIWISVYIFPMLIACYFVYVTHCINKNYKKIQL